MSLSGCQATRACGKCAASGLDTEVVQRRCGGRELRQRPAGLLCEAAAFGVAAKSGNMCSAGNRERTKFDTGGRVAGAQRMMVHRLGHPRDVVGGGVRRGRGGRGAGRAAVLGRGIRQQALG